MIWERINFVLNYCFVKKNITIVKIEIIERRKLILFVELKKKNKTKLINFIT